MSDAILTTVIGVVGTGFIATFFFQLQFLRDDMKQGFKEQAERLTRIETTLDIHPPAEAA